MRTELEQLARIERYLQGEMTKAEQLGFETEAVADPGLSQEVALQQLLVQAIERQGLRDELAAIHLAQFPPPVEEVPKFGGRILAFVATHLRPKRLALAAVLIFGLQLCHDPFPNRQVSGKLGATKPAFVPTFNEFDVPFQSLEVVAERGKHFQLANGSQINVPAQAFVNKNGDPVQGNVQLNYREFHHAAEIIASGIPMEYQGGVFESGGMFELRGQQASEPVFIAKGSKIEVKLASFTDESEFKHYYLREPMAKEPTTAHQGFGIYAAQAQTTREAGPEWLETGPSVSQPNAGKWARLDSLEKWIYRQAQTKAQLAIDQSATRQTGQTEIAADSTDNLWEFRLRVASAASNPINDTSEFALQNTALQNMLAQQPVTWRYVDKFAAGQNPNLVRNRWVLDQTWSSVVLTTPLFVPVRRLTKTGAVTQPQPAYVAFSPDSHYFLTGNEGNVELWDRQGNFIRTFKNTHFAVFAPDSSQILLANAQEARLVEVTGRVRARFRTMHRTKFQRMEFSADGQTLLGLGADENICLWNRQGQLLAQMKDSRNSWFTEAMFFQPDGSEVIAKAHDGAIFRFNRVGEQLAKPTRYARNYPIISPELTAKPIKKEFVHLVNGIDQAGQTTKTRSKQVVPALKILKNNQLVDWLHLDNPRHHFVQAYFSPDAQLALITVDNGTTRLWQRNSADSVQRMELGNQQASFMTYVRKFAPLPAPNSHEPALGADLMASYLVDLRARFAEAKATIESEANVLRAFGVSEFGVHNVDRIYSDPSVISLRAELDFGTPELNQPFATAGFKGFYLTGERGNVVIRFDPANLANFPLSPKGKNQLIVLLPGQRAAICGAEDFAQLDWSAIRQAKQCTFRLRLTPQRIRSLADWQALLGQNT